MCGIAGVYLNSGQVAQSVLGRFCRALGHRGPDDAGVLADGPVGLAHTRLSIIDLAGGHQPLVTADGELALAANGEIYNYLELRADLKARGFRFATGSDCEPLLHAYRDRGDDFLDAVEGMFAFALYDRARRRLVLARDRLGIKPLFIARRPEGLYFASELKALLAVMPAKPGVDPAGLAQYLESGFTSGRATVLEDVERVLPGEMITVEADGRVERRPYWSALEVAPLETDFEGAVERFDALLEQTMGQHMRSDVPYGLFLSGGVDSAVLLALLSRYAGEPVRTFSVGFEAGSVADELPAARAMAERFGSRHEEIPVDSQRLWRHLPHAVWAADELMGDYANAPTSLLARAAGRELKVVFTGEGGDEVFAGYGRYRSRGLQRWLRALAAPGTGGFRTRGTFTRLGRHGLFGPTLAGAAAGWREPFVAAWGETPGAWSDLQRRQYVDLRTWLGDDLLVKADRMLMAWGVEGRVPFLDHRVVEFGLAL
ncbi:MAG TPA: asparagine synthase (glutamine-hydrolyzing), partial [Gammaproteobacteria bacterium]|nr:asparagine synthase (glutamine-hydrolyzing) [Gammaproteobacteria bacterium]